jgi:uncharacterized membrane protein
MTEQLNLWLHLLAITVFLGSGVTLLVVLMPMAAQLSSPQDKQKFLSQSLKAYNPLSIGALGVIIMTGAFNLTAYKEQLGPQFFELLGGILGFKLLLVFVLIMISTSAIIGMGHRLVRTDLRGEEFDPEKLPGLIKRMQIFTILYLALTAWVVWVSLDMTKVAKSLPARTPHSYQSPQSPPATPQPPVPGAEAQQP